MDFPINIKHIKIKTDRLLLRTWNKRDLKDFFEYASEPGVGELAGWPAHTNKRQTKRILNAFIEYRDVFAIYHVADKKVIGSIGLHDAWQNNHQEYKHLRNKNIGYVLAKPYWGSGIMVEAVNAVIDYGFLNLGVDSFGIEHFNHNTQSQRVIEKLGFTFVKNGRFHADELGETFDEKRYVLTRQQWRMFQ